MPERTIIDYKWLKIRYKETADEEVTALLEKSVVGTPGRLRYSVQDIGKRLRYYEKSLSFISYCKKDELIGVIGLCRRKTESFGSVYDSTFLRYLSVRTPFQISSAANRRKGRKKERSDQSLKQKLFSLFIDPLKLPGVKDTNKPQTVYACIEGENVRSRNFAGLAGYEHIRSICTISFSRFNPSPYHNVRRLSAAEEPAMAALIADFYKGYTFWHDQFTFLNHNYYVMMKGNEIIAGVSALPTVFRIQEFPGIQGWILLNVMPYLPLMRKIFTPGEFRFLVLDYIYCRKGEEHLLPDLFESVCASERHHSAVTWLDDRSDLFRAISQTGRMGVLNKILKTSPGLIFASFPNFSNDEKKRFAESPVFMSGMDMA